MKIGIIGQGFVGGALGKLLEEVHEVKYYDKFKECNDLGVLNDCQAIFICVPTNDKDGDIDLSAVEDAVKNASNKLLIMKSTVTPGTTERLAKKYGKQIVFNPEFLRQDFAEEDMRNTDRIIIGTNTHGEFKTLLEIYEEVLPNATCIRLPLRTAEMIKYAANITLASQIATANEIYKICKKLDIDYDDVKDIILLDERIGKNIDVPGPDGQLGFGGACFPKDLNALISLSRKNGYSPELLIKIKEFNEGLR